MTVQAGLCQTGSEPINCWFSHAQAHPTFRLLLQHGADRNILTEDGERPIDLVEPTDLATFKIMLDKQSTSKSRDSSEDELEDRARKRYGVVAPVVTG